MDDVTKKMIDDFIDYLAKEARNSKHLMHLQIGTWSIKDFKITVHIFVDGKSEKMFFDVREIKDNVDRFGHLLGNAAAQLQKIRNNITQ